MVDYNRVKSAYLSLPEWDRQSISTNDLMREQFLESFNHPNPQHIDLYLEHLLALESNDLERLEATRETLCNYHEFEKHILDAAETSHKIEQQIRVSIVQHKVVEGMDFDEALAYKPTRIEYDEAHRYVRSLNNIPLNRHDVLLHEIMEALDNAPAIYGKPDLTKTEILQTIKKDKGEWRTAAKEVLLYLTAKNHIAKVGPRYHHTNHQPRMVETDFTRKVFECLYANNLTINGIVKLIGYDNSYGRRKVKRTLELLQAEGLVAHKGYKWYQLSS
jgi:hypothetical protein